MVLPYIEMNPPQVYMCSPSWTLLPPSSPYHPSESSHCTSPKHPVSHIDCLVFYSSRNRGFSPCHHAGEIECRGDASQRPYQILEESITGLSGSDAMTQQLLLDPLISHLKPKTSPAYLGQHPHGSSRACLQAGWIIHMLCHSTLGLSIWPQVIKCEWLF